MHIYDHLAHRLTSYTLPAGILPLARSRQPFDGICEPSIAELIALTNKHPGKVGRLAAAIREECLLPNPPTSGTVIEAHLDCTTLPVDFVNTIVALGFEPDHFVEFVPNCYPDHYTLKFVTDAGHRSGIFRLVRKACEDLITVWKSYSEVRGYLELEIYPTSYRTTVDWWRPWKDGGVLPFTAGTLRSVDEASDGEFKRADIHVKTPTPARGIPLEKTDGATMTLLRASLLNMGFYPVLTEAGHRVYTAQFLDRTEGRIVYDALAAHFTDAGGIIDIIFEPCVFFWKSDPTAPIPPVVRLC